MSVNWKAILSLFIIFAIVGLLVFSPKGKRIVGNTTAPIGSFLKTITGKITRSGEKVESRKLDIILTDISPYSLGDIEISINGDDFEGKLNYEMISLLDSEIRFDNKEVNVQTRSLIGSIDFFRNSNMKITGKTDSLKLNSMEITKPDIDFLIVGEPVSYEIENIEKDKLVFSSISGSLKCSQLTGGTLMLSNDQLELINFDGSIKQGEGSVTISGQVDKMRLNGVEISKS
ncbi:MAG: hypothetical protein ISS48_05095 [Candidatus Aenigmarchaeota archaeon]|nr:hypothetical protein [Candidatus Aenigmarchaeota archaeon]